MEVILYIYLLLLTVFVGLVIAYRLGASSLRSELQMMAPEIEQVVFPRASQPIFAFYSAIPLKILFRPESVAPSLPASTIARLASLSCRAIAAAVAACASFMLLAVLLSTTSGQGQ